MKKHWHSKMTAKNVPKQLWDLGLKHAAKIMQLLPRNPSNRTGYEMVTGKTLDISEFCDFDFLGPCLVFPRNTPHHECGRSMLGKMGRCFS